MAPPNNAERLTWLERLKVGCVSLGFVLVFGFLGWLFWAFNPVWNTDWIGKEFWELVGVGRYRVPKGFVVLFDLVFYLVVLPVAWLVFVAGVFHALRGRRTRLSAWILRQVSHEEVRNRYKGTLKSLDTEEDITNTDKVLQNFLPPAVGWAIFLACVIVGAAVLVWAATRE